MLQWVVILTISCSGPG